MVTNFVQALRLQEGGMDLTKANHQEGSVQHSSW